MTANAQEFRKFLVVRFDLLFRDSNAQAQDFERVIQLVFGFGLGSMVYEEEKEYPASYRHTGPTVTRQEDERKWDVWDILCREFLSEKSTPFAPLYRCALI